MLVLDIKLCPTLNKRLQRHGKHKHINTHTHTHTYTHKWGEAQIWRKQQCNIVTSRCLLVCLPAKCPDFRALQQHEPGCPSSTLFDRSDHSGAPGEASPFLRCSCSRFAGPGAAEDPHRPPSRKHPHWHLKSETHRA